MKELMLKMNHLERYRQKGLATKVIPNTKDDDFSDLAALNSKTWLSSGSTRAHEITLRQDNYQESSLPNLPS